MPICPKSGDKVQDLGVPTRNGAYSIREQAWDAVQNGDQLLGRCLGRNFAITHVLGHGMMGTVYEAMHLQLGRASAVKVLREDLVAPLSYTHLTLPKIGSVHILGVAES